MWNRTRRECEAQRPVTFRGRRRRQKDPDGYTRVRQAECTSIDECTTQRATNVTRATWAGWALHCCSAHPATARRPRPRTTLHSPPAPLPISTLLHHSITFCPSPTLAHSHKAQTVHRARPKHTSIPCLSTADRAPLRLCADNCPFRSLPSTLPRLPPRVCLSGPRNSSHNTHTHTIRTLDVPGESFLPHRLFIRAPTISCVDITASALHLHWSPHTRRAPHRSPKTFLFDPPRRPGLPPPRNTAIHIVLVITSRIRRYHCSRCSKRPTCDCIGLSRATPFHLARFS